MFTTRARTIVTVAVALEIGVAGYVAGYGALWLLVATVVLTAGDTLWGVARRRVVADLVGIEVAVALAVTLLAGWDGAGAPLLAAACLAWLIRPERRRGAHTSNTGTA